jgi:hypothetical protein
VGQIEFPQKVFLQMIGGGGGGGGDSSGGGFVKQTKHTCNGMIETE